MRKWRIAVGFPAGLVLLLIAGCGRGGGLTFNEETLFFNAILLPAGESAPIESRDGLAACLTELEKSVPEWAPAAVLARKTVLAPSANFRIKPVAPEDFEIPGVKYLNTFGYGFAEDDLLRCASSPRAVQLILSGPPDQIATLYPAAQAVALAAATRMNGYVYDVNAKMVFTPAAYRQVLFNPATFDIRQHVLVQKYAYETGRFRAVTLGMAKFGCPEVEARDFSADNSLTVQYLVYAAAAALIPQRLKQNAPPAFPGELSLPIALIKGGFIDPLSGSSAPAGSAKAVRIGLERGTQDPGDSQENIVRLVPPGDYRGKPAEWMSGLAGELMGFQDKVDYLSSPSISEDIVQKVRQTLPGALDRYLPAKSAGARLYVKFSYRIEGKGVEYLWLEVDRWTDRTVSGVLVNEPYLAKNLRAGSPLEISRGEIVDWLLRDSSGKAEGNFTGAGMK